MDMFGKIIYEMYGLTLTEYAFYIAESLIYIGCVIFLFVGILKHHRKARSANSRLLLASVSGLIVFGVVSGVASDILFVENENYSLFELLIVYFPTVFIVLLTLGLWNLLKETSDRAISGS